MPSHLGFMSPHLGFTVLLPYSQQPWNHFTCHSLYMSAHGAPGSCPSQEGENQGAKPGHLRIPKPSLSPLHLQGGMEGPCRRHTAQAKALSQEGSGCRGPLSERSGPSGLQPNWVTAGFWPRHEEVLVGGPERDTPSNLGHKDLKIEREAHEGFLRPWSIEWDGG